MTFVGKVLIVVQMVLTIFFMGFAGAVYVSQANWKAESEKQAKLVQSANQSFSDGKTAWETKERELTEKATTQEQRALLAENQVVQKDAQIVDLQKDKDQLDTLKGVLDAESTLTKIEADDRREEALTLRAINNKLHETMRNLATRLRSAEDKIFADEKQMEQMERKHQAALEEIANWKLIAQSNGWNEDPKEYTRGLAPPPAVDGLVLDARKSDDRGQELLVRISLGERDGLVRGHQLDIYRPASRNQGRSIYLGRIRLVNVTANEAVGMLVQRVQNGIIEKDDHVTTKL
jgi:chromosome segregation ATPase